jgi:UDP-glucose 4-epimerase
MPKILITGGAGFIGSNLADKLISGGEDVVIVDNLFTGRLSYLNPTAKFYLADIRDDVINNIFAIEKPDIVIHLAAQMSVPFSVEQPRLDLDINLNGLLNLLAAAVKHEVKKFVFSSSGGTVYGDVKYPVDEMAPLKPFPPYAITKTTSEHYLAFYRKQYGLDYVVLRFANVYGPRQVSAHESGVVTIFTEKFLRKEPAVIYTFPHQKGGMKRDYVFVGDVVKALAKAMYFTGSDVFNIGTGIPTETLEILNTLDGILGYSIDYKFGPPRDGDLEETYLLVDKAEKILGWEPDITLKDGLEKTVDYFKTITDVK